jgi:ABC-type nitrate/sulfonate/bicarbonate transport system substrate-binding protein
MKQLLSIFTRLIGISAVLFWSASVYAQEHEHELLVPLTDVSLNKLPYIVAEQQGLFKKYGIDVELYITPGAAAKGAGDGMDPNPKYVRDVQSDRMLTTGGGVGLIHSRVGDRSDRVIIGSTDNQLRWFLYARPGINSLEDLKGKVIAATDNNSCTGGIVHLIANRMGWVVGKDITLKENHEERLDRLGAEYDAVIISELPHVHAEKLGMYPLVDLRDWDLPYLCSGISASKSWLEQEGNREKAIAFMKATIEAMAMMKRDHTVVYQALDEWYGVKDIETKQKMYDTVPDLVDVPYPAVEGVQLIMDTYKDYSPNMVNYTADDFYDNSIMQEIVESGFIEELNK